MTTNKVKSHSTRSLLCLILFRKNIFCRGKALDACYQRFMTKGCKYATKCQCPLGLIPHFYGSSRYDRPSRICDCVNALSGLYLISTVPLQKPRFYAVFRVCFCRYLSEYSDNNRFSCMLTFWTYLMRCTYP